MLSKPLPTSLVSPLPFHAYFLRPFHSNVPQLEEKHSRSGNRSRHHSLVLALATLVLTIYLPAHAQEIEAGAVLICDTQKQVERYAQLFHGDEQVAIRAVNSEENDPNACALVDASYVQGPDVGVARSSSHAFRIVPIVVLGLSSSHGYGPVTPVLFFTPVKIDEVAI